MSRDLSRDSACRSSVEFETQIACWGSWYLVGRAGGVASLDGNGSDPPLVGAARLAPGSTTTSAAASNTGARSANAASPSVLGRGDRGVERRFLAGRVTRITRKPRDPSLTQGYAFFRTAPRDAESVRFVTDVPPVVTYVPPRSSVFVVVPGSLMSTIPPVKSRRQTPFQR